MSYLDIFNKKGICVSVYDDKTLRFDPKELVTDDLIDMARENKAQIIDEIKESAGKLNPDSNPLEVAPDYQFLWVATDLTSFEEYDPRFGYELGRNPVYRMLDAQYYAWLRHRMENVSKVHGNGQISDDEYTVLRERFNAIHNWAITRIGEQTLRQMMRTTDVTRYIPPCDETLDAYHRTWAEARKVYKAKLSNANHNDPQVEKLRNLLSTQGYAVIKSPVVNDIIIFVRDDSVVIPTKWSHKVKYTMDELILMIGLPADTVKQIFDVKQLFGGKVIKNNEGQPIVAADNSTEQTVTEIQGSMF
ncbi:MAG: hypothetical protein ACYC27_23245 [Armatimonadota bacterium]